MERGLSEKRKGTRPARVDEDMSTPVPYEQLAGVFGAGDFGAGLETLVAALRAGADYHSLFRVLLLRKRHELGLPLLNPGNLSGCPADLRQEYKTFVDETCREIGELCLGAGDIAQGWRYLSAVGEPAPVRAALEKVDATHVSDEVLKIALEAGVHPQRGFQWTLERQGLGRAITLFDDGFSTVFADRQYAAGLLVRTLYRDLLLSVCKAIVEREGALPKETDLVELVRGRQWLFEGGRVHADANHIGAVSRIGLVAAAREDLIMSLCVSEYGRLLSAEHQVTTQPLFEEGFRDHARFARALLGESVEETTDYFRSKLYNYYGAATEGFPQEMVVLLFWRLGRKDEALDIWQQHLVSQPPERPGKIIPSYYELCLEAGLYSRLADSARMQDDVSAWAAAKIMEQAKAAATAPAVPAADTAPAAEAEEAPAAHEDRSEPAQARRDSSSEGAEGAASEGAADASSEGAAGAPPAKEAGDLS